MKVFVIQSGSGDPTWSHTVKIEQGVQSFTLDYKGTLQECQWYAEQFKTALDIHTTEALVAAKETFASTPAPAQDQPPSVQNEAPTQPADTTPVNDGPATGSTQTATATGNTAADSSTSTEASDVPAAQ